ncbi:TraR/DksA family transcriptional regulator [Photobacterium sp. ZSDE20]|uniref:TraR/DksA family transcriptional regulator n=1 Tax=Photobacterium pectinilyticum TaxID=2906793 RepID=A0ABT1N0Y4_9GAMM|nr:TraR/DksA family transcriptional regulator [Photobacterium sp. ZSDE20]MCQ1058387.1 TraR/DksA family transcriptional regulator [Photobacterium sp. ZSDE20]MDD1825250.1 TraR/DksA family transcriptional regulator [Photobacterium sp. ZSDE20]
MTHDQLSKNLYILQNNINTELQAKKFDIAKHREENGSGGDEVDVANSINDLNRIISDANKLKVKQRQIQAAIGRAEHGEYGLCIECGEQIPAGRLLSLPLALRCVDCESLQPYR